MSYAEPFSSRKALLEAARSRSTKRAPTALRVSKDFAGAVEPVGSRCFRFTLSTSSIDRASDMVDQGGWDLRAYLRNPVVLLDHGYHPVLGNLPIGRSVAIGVEGGRLKATVELDAATVPITGPYAEMVCQKLAKRSLFSCSVAFRPLDFAIADRPADIVGLNFKRQDLTEWSIVGVPCNPECVTDDPDDTRAAIAAVTSAAPRGTRKVTPGAALHRLQLLDRIDGL